MTNFNKQETAEKMLLNRLDDAQALIAKKGVHIDHDGMVGSFFFFSHGSEVVLYLTPFWEGSDRCDYSVMIDGDVIITSHEPLTCTPSTTEDNMLFAYMAIANRLLAALNI